MRFKQYYEDNKVVLLEAAFSGKKMERVMTLIKKVLSRKLGMKLHQELGVNQFKNANGRGVGIRYFLGDSTGAIRFNFKGNEIMSIDIWGRNSNSKTPDVNMDVSGKSIVKIIPLIVDVINTPMAQQIEFGESVDFKGNVIEEGIPIIVMDKEFATKRLAIDYLVSKGVKKASERKKIIAGATTLNVTRGKPETPTNQEAKAAKKIVPKFADPDTIFDDLTDLIKMVVAGVQPSLLITGGPGTGKTFTVIDKLKKAGLKKGTHWVHIKGAVSPMGLYRTLFDNQDKLIVFDDSDDIFKDSTSINLLKGALDSFDVREISWVSRNTFNPDKVDEDDYNKLIDDGKLPSRFEFKGKVIFISNISADKIDGAVKSRSLTIDVSLRASDVLKRIESILVKILPETSISVKKEVLAYLKTRVSQMEDNLDVNLRTFINAAKIRTSNSKNWKRLIERYA